MVSRRRLSPLSRYVRCMAIADECDAVVVGSGPNGLAAAVILSRAGLHVRVLEAQPTIGGGARTLELGLAPGMRHDVCSAVHPLAVGSPFFANFDLPSRGVKLAQPGVAYAHPLDGHPAAVAYRSLDRTVEELEGDGRAWKRLLEPLVKAPDAVVAAALGDKRSVPCKALQPASVQFGLRVAEQGSRAWNVRFSGVAAPALITGVAAHSITQLPSLAAAGTAMLLGSLAHNVGWPIPEGGSQSIVDAMTTDLKNHGGEIVTNCPITSASQLPKAAAYLFDTAPDAIGRIFGDRLPWRYRRLARSFRFGNAASKVDFVLSGPVPWADPRVGGAGTVHVGGTRADMAYAEREVAKGRHAERPMTLLSQPAVADSTRLSRSGVRPLWTYAHVPAGSTVDTTEAITAHIERFAPGFRDVIISSHCTPAAELPRHNANYIGGDIAAGAVDMYRMVARPSLQWNPYKVPVPGVYICSASTPPGPGVHGMCGYFAAKRVLRERFGIRTMPRLAP